RRRSGGERSTGQLQPEGGEHSETTRAHVPLWGGGSTVLQSVRRGTKIVAPATRARARTREQRCAVHRRPAEADNASPPRQPSGRWRRCSLFPVPFPLSIERAQRRSPNGVHPHLCISA